MAQPFEPAFEPAFQPTPGLASEVKPPKNHLRTGVILMVVAILAATILGFFASTRFPDVASYPRASGEGQPVTLTAGSWTVFAEDGTLAAPEEILAPDGQPVDIRPLSGSQNYNLSGHSGRGVATFEAPVDGEYLVTTQPGGLVAFTSSFGRDTATAVVSILAAVFLGGAVFVAGVIFTLMGLSARRRT